jgi:hypothetical protein
VEHIGIPAEEWVGLVAVTIALSWSALHLLFGDPFAAHAVLQFPSLAEITQSPELGGGLGGIV